MAWPALSHKLRGRPTSTQLQLLHWQRVVAYNVNSVNAAVHLTTAARMALQHLV